MSANMCDKCNTEFIHITQHEYKCFKCDKNICITCIKEHCNEGTGHIYCPMCNNVWEESKYTLHFAPFQCRLLLKLSQEIRGFTISKDNTFTSGEDTDCSISGKKRKRLDSYSNDSPPSKKPYISVPLLEQVTNITEYTMNDCSNNAFHLSKIIYKSEDDAASDSDYVNDVINGNDGDDEDSEEEGDIVDAEEDAEKNSDDADDTDDADDADDTDDTDDADDADDTDDADDAEEIAADVQQIIQNLFGNSMYTTPIIVRHQTIPAALHHKIDTQSKQPQEQLSILKELTEKDIQYFNTLSDAEKKEIESRYKDIQTASQTDNKTPLIIKILRNKAMPMKVQEHALEMIKTLRGGCGSETSSKTQEWLRGLLKIPFGVTKSLPIYIDRNNKESCSTFLENARRQLDKTIYGMDTVKMQIIQMMGLWIVNPKAASQPIGLCGPAGVGKTSILRNGIAAILDRPFAMIPLGGLSDARMLKGFELTYVGSQCGRVVRVLQETQVMNPVILFDEVDKISTKNGTDEVSATLIHITDRTSNTDYQDIYFNGIPIDISGALMAFSMNDIQSVNPILRNRMHIIHVPAYKKKEKLAILQQYIIPRIEDEYRFHNDFSKDTLTWFIEQFDGGEGGVRMLIYAVEKLYSRLNIGRMNPKLLENIIIKDYLNITKDDIQKIMNIYDDEKTTDANEWWKQLYV